MVVLTRWCWTAAFASTPGQASCSCQTPTARPLRVRDEDTPRESGSWRRGAILFWSRCLENGEVADHENQIFVKVSSSQQDKSRLRPSPCSRYRPEEDCCAPVRSLALLL